MVPAAYRASMRSAVMPSSARISALCAPNPGEGVQAFPAIDVSTAERPRRHHDGAERVDLDRFEEPTVCHLRVELRVAWVDALGSAHTGCAERCGGVGRFACGAPCADRHVDGVVAVPTGGSVGVAQGHELVVTDQVDEGGATGRRPRS